MIASILWLEGKTNLAPWAVVFAAALLIAMNNLETWIRQLIQDGELWKFYKSRPWKQLKESVLKEAHYECQVCRQHGIITRYDIDEDGRRRRLSTVHHAMHVRDHPELALSRTYRDPVTGEQKQNLIAICKACHNREHPEKFRRRHKKSEGFTNIERW